MFLEAVLVSFLVALLRGGRLKDDFGIRHMWIAPVAFVLQQVNSFWVPAAFNAPITLISYALLLYFAWANLANQGVRLILVGMLLNVLVIVANGGRIPVDIAAASSIGVDVSLLEEGVIGKHAALTADSLLPFLGDVIPVPFPIARIISVGDIFAVIGVFLLIQDMMGKRIPILDRTHAE